jgi:hypothetical protein
MSRCFRIAFSTFEIAPRMLPVLSAIVRKPNGSLYRFPLRKKNRSKSLDLTDHLPPRLSTIELSECAHLVEGVPRRPNHSVP